MGWLHAIPETKGKVKRSRLALLELADKEPQYPELEEAAYMLPLFLELGVILHHGMGAAPMSWQEIESWKNLSGLELDYWELLTLKEMSYAYASEYGNATDPQRIAPYVREVKEVDHEQMAKKWISFVESHNKNFQKKAVNNVS